ncbi:hypothetical protein L484_002093 [Morus notabilis]|uniref:Uncharacterized protein n=1 Tax=Morus notabilis TaxID=981085 RepID=W9RJA7_9ROSA|nr:myosin-7 [Morus notabilis]EXB93887.1 hypothetical protein L484_002093 [Morus notabilis]
MAKKKVTHQSKDHHHHQQQQQQPKPQEEAPQNPQNRVTTDSAAAAIAVAMDDSSEKLQSLKSLNARLLKETFEGRQQIDSLVKAKESLDAELTRAGLEKKVLSAELTRASEESVGLELEKGVFGVYVEAQIREREFEIGSLKREVRELLGCIENEREKLVRVCEERDVLRRDFDGLVSEANGLREKVRETEKRERLVKEEVEKLRAQCEGILKEKEERKGAVEGLKKEKVLAERNLVESERLVEKLKSENVKISSEKNEAERIRSGLAQQIGALEKEVGEKNGIVSGLRGEVGVLRGKILGLEKAVGDGRKGAERKLAESNRLVEKLQSEREKISSEKSEAERIKGELEVQIGVLEKEVGQKNEIVLDLLREVEVMRAKISVTESFISEGMKEMEREVKSLKEEKEKSIEKLHSQLYVVELALKMTTMEANDKELRIEELIRKKSEIEEGKANQESEIVALHNEVGDLRDALFALRNSCRDYEENNKQLLSEVGHYKDTFDRVTLERNEAQKAFNEERKNAVHLKLVISEKEKRVQEFTVELRGLKDERKSLLDNAKTAEGRLGSLVKERDSAQKSLLEAKSRMEEWKAKVESAGGNYEKALAMLKTTASMISSSQSEHGKRELVNNEEKLEEEVQPYVSELEAIQNAFRNKEKAVEDMKKQVESLKRAEAEAHKKKSFWALVSSAITIFAAASVAYVAKAR